MDTTAFELLTAAPRTVRALLAAVPADAASRPVDGGWSANDVVAHLVDTESVAFTDRIRRILAEDRPSFPPIDPSERLGAAGYASWPLDKLLDAFEKVRAESVAMLRGQPAGAFERIGRHQEAGEVSVSDLANYAAVHDMMHLSQIAKMLQSQLAGRVGNMRRYLDE
jgi:hypothetical protein